LLDSHLQDCPELFKSCMMTGVGGGGTGKAENARFNVGDLPVCQAFRLD